MLERLERLLLFLIIIFLPTQLGKHFWPTFSFIYSLPIDYLSPVIYFWDLLVGFLWIIVILEQKHINRLALNLLLGFIFTQVLSLLWSLVGIGVGLVRLEQYLIAGIFGIYIASCKFSEVKSVIFYALIGSILAQAILAAGQFIHGGTLGFWILGERTFSLSTPAIAKFDFFNIQFLRPYATFPHPNVLAAYMIVILITLNTFWDLKLSPRLKVVLFLLTFITTLLTVSRTAIFAGVISSLVIFKRKGRLLIILMMVILLPVLYIRYSSLLNFDSLTLLRREELSLVALDLWYKAPILGVGLNSFIVVASDLLLSGPSRFLQPVHNIFLLALSETGIIGLLGLTGLIGYPLFLIFKLSPKLHPLNPLFLVWGVIIFLGLLDHYFLTLAQGYRLLFFVWGLTLARLEKI